MQKQVPKIIIILGPTASGKSAAAIEVAKEFNGEIISADSRQIYRGLDIGSGKVIRDSRSHQSKIIGHQVEYISDGIMHHLIDVAQPLEDFNISHFKKLAEKAIGEILQKGKLPIICGGTGFWIDSITQEILIPKVEPNLKLRAELENETVEKLFKELATIDPERAENIDSKNKVRLIRAIEICKAIGKVPDKSLVVNNKLPRYKFLEIGIQTTREELNTKIKKRLMDRFTEGMIAEVENLHKKGVSFEWLEKIGLEYRWIARYLQKKVSLEEMQEKLYFDIIHYAKRQMTWFGRNKKILWLTDYKEIKKEIAKFLAK